MDELVQKVAERAGIEPSQAEKAIAAVFEQLQERLPEPFASQITGLVGGGGGGGGGGSADPSDMLKGLTDNLGGLFKR